MCARWTVKELGFVIWDNAVWLHEEILKTETAEMKNEENNDKDLWLHELSQIMKECELDGPPDNYQKYRW